MHAPKLLSILVVLVLVVTGCSFFGADAPTVKEAGVAESPTQELAVATTPPTADLGEASQATIVPAKIHTARPYLPSGFDLAQFYDFSLTEGEFPAQGATLNFTLDTPVAEGQMATIARWEPTEQIWEPLETTVSLDGTQLSAKTEHFSEYGVVLTWVEELDLQKRLLLGDATRPPTCEDSPLSGSEPDWSDMQFFEDKLSPTLWCVSGVKGQPENLIVRFVWSRGTSAKITTALEPLSVSTDLLDGDPASILLANVAHPEVSINGSLQEFVVQPLGQYSFKFDRKALNDLYQQSPDQALIRVATHLGYVAMGLAYDQLVDLAGPVPAGVLVLASAGDCQGTFANNELVKQGDTALAINATIGCLESVTDLSSIVATLVPAGLVTSSITTASLERTAKQGVKKLKTYLKFLNLLSAAQKFSSALADAQLNDVTRKATYTPSTKELTRLIRARLTSEFESCVPFGASISYGEDLPPSGCKFLDPLEIEHPAYGRVKFVVGLLSVDDWPALTYWLLDSDDQVISRRSSGGDIPWYIDAPRLDGNGNIIYTYNPGRSDGCVALRAKDNWFEGFGTDPMQVPEGESHYGTRFYGCQWTDENRDGVKEILYMPTGGATNNPQPKLFIWNGEDYNFSGYRPFPDGSWLPGYGPSS